MTTKPSKTDPWEKVNEGKFNFAEHARDLDRADLFAPLDLRGSGADLRSFIERETHTSISDNRTSETLAPGVYLRRQANGWELLIRHTRGAFLAFYGTKEELLAIAEQKMEERNGRHLSVQ